MSETEIILVIVLSAVLIGLAMVMFVNNNRGFIWWHRRRANRHAALKVYRYIGGRGDVSQWHETWSKWHLAQIERLSK